MLWTGLGFTAVGWLVLLGAVWGDLHYRVAAGLVGEGTRTPRPFGCLTLVGLLSTLAGTAVLFVHGWPWGVGAAAAGVLWTQWLSRVVLQWMDPEGFERIRELRNGSAAGTSGGDDEEE